MLVSEIKVSLFNTAYFASDSVQILDTTDYEATFRGELIELLYLTTVYRKPLKFTALASLIEALRNNADEDHPLRYHDCLELVASGLPVDTLKQFANSSASYEDFMQRDTELPFFLWLSLYSTKV